MLRTVKISFSQHWKKLLTEMISDWEFKLREYATIAKLTAYILTTVKQTQARMVSRNTIYYAALQI